MVQRFTLDSKASSGQANWLQHGQFLKQKGNQSKFTRLQGGLQLELHSDV